MPTIASQRTLFDIAADASYLNAAYMGPMPRATAAAGAASYARRCQPWQYDPQADFFDLPETFRAHIAALLGVTAEDVAIAPSVSYGLATAALALSPPAGSEVLVLAEQFPSNVYVWRTLAERHGARVRTVQRADHETWTEALLAAIGPATSIVACQHVHWVDGGELDLERVAQAARGHGAALALDLTQSLGVLPVDLSAIQPDFAAAVCYKWLLGPYTLGAVYIAPKHQNGPALEEGWITREGAENFARLVDYAERYADGARRFDVGERSAFQLIPAANASLEQVRAWGVANIAETLAARTDQIVKAVAPLDLRADTPARAPHYLALTLPAGTPSDLVKRLAARQVYVSQRGARLRVTPHVYNNDGDVARLVNALKAEMGAAGSSAQ
ncbi:MAG: aminotransferase class V-fold PLP-dependent enzyme [Myxococcales bacterium]|nr:aminotransferase class V-fold PLP-dependent enzyme [Myxococcales bacterium]